MIPTTPPYDYHLSMRVALTIEAAPYRCWRNAVVAMVLLPQLFSSWKYIEGWAVLPKEASIEIIEHGWIALETHTVDPSFVLVEKPDQRIFYFPGVSLSWEQVYHFLPGATLPLVCHSQYGENGMAHSGYREAYEKACKIARELVEENHLPLSAISVLGRDPRRGLTMLQECE